MREDLKRNIKKDEIEIIPPQEISFFQYFKKYIEDAPVSPGRKRSLNTVYKKVIKTRNRRCAILGEKYPQWDKTLVTDINEKVIFNSFREFSNSFLNHIYICLDKIKWARNMGIAEKN